MHGISESPESFLPAIHVRTQRRQPCVSRDAGLTRY